MQLPTCSKPSLLSDTSRDGLWLGYYSEVASVELDLSKLNVCSNHIHLTQVITFPSPMQSSKQQTGKIDYKTIVKQITYFIYNILTVKDR